jgi:hypothetical protein
LRASIAAFLGKYLRQVGTLYAELNEWNAKIAAPIADKEGTEKARSAAASAGAQAAESDTAVHGEAANANDFEPSPELKSFYREVAKRAHPDPATDEADRQNRERYMKRANQAYEQGDEEELKRILAEYDSSPDSVKGAGVAADLIRVIRQVKQIKNRLTQIESEIASLVESDIAKLKAKVETAAAQGRDLLAEMVANVQTQIDSARRIYQAGTSETENV